MKQYIEIVDIFGRESFRQVRQQVFLRLWNLGIMTKSVTAVKV